MECLYTPSAADARLIAAAPELLEKLREARGHIPDPGSITRRYESHDIGAEIDALIARIEADPAIASKNPPVPASGSEDA